jgi:hypothetical protein
MESDGRIYWKSFAGVEFPDIGHHNSLGTAKHLPGAKIQLFQPKSLGMGERSRIGRSEDDESTGKLERGVMLF